MMYARMQEVTDGKRNIRMVLITISFTGQFQIPDKLREELKFSSLRIGLNDCMFTGENYPY